MQAILDGCYLLLVKGLSFCVYNLLHFIECYLLNLCQFLLLICLVNGSVIVIFSAHCIVNTKQNLT
jgi:hypothetical protein